MQPWCSVFFGVKLPTYLKLKCFDVEVSCMLCQVTICVVILKRSIRKLQQYQWVDTNVFPDMSRAEEINSSN